MSRLPCAWVSTTLCVISVSSVPFFLRSFSSSSSLAQIRTHTPSEALLRTMACRSLRAASLKPTGKSVIANARMTSFFSRLS